MYKLSPSRAPPEAREGLVPVVCFGGHGRQSTRYCLCTSCKDSIGGYLTRMAFTSHV